VAIPRLLQELLTAVGPSGAEEPAARVWRDAASEFAEVESDTLGTSFARVGPESGPTLAVIGHLDEIGIAITEIDAGGLLAYSTIGGFEADILAGQRIVIAGRDGAVEGVVGSRSRSRRERSDRAGLRHDDLHIDIGARSAKDAGERVALGDVGVWHGAPLELPNGRIASRALDNRLGAYAALEAARRIAELGSTNAAVVAVASVQEEVGHDGARAAAFALEPDVALVVDVTWSTDVPGESTKRAGKVELGSGAAITRGTVVNRHVSDLLVRAAEEDAIPHSVEVYTGATYTDADDVHGVRSGVPTGVVSIPIRYMHTPNELVALADLEAVIALLVAFASRLGPDTSFLR
jgi:putative aminopeptidase FrvX